MKNKLKKLTDIRELLQMVEHELADWKYYQAINGKSVIATLFFFFLKFLNDTYKNTFNEPVNIMSEIKKFLIYGREIPDKYVYEYLEKLVEQWSDSGEILLQYVQRINFAAIPVDFIEILNWLEDVDFSGEDDWDNFIFVASELYTSLYGEIEVKNKRNIGECYIIRVAGEALDCKKNMSVFDFSCGTGGLLLAAGKMDCAVYAEEADFEKLVVSYILLRMTKCKEIHFKVGDVIAEKLVLKADADRFDRIISAPPIGKRYNIGNEFWRYVYYTIERLKEDGRAVIVAPISVLSKEGLSKQDREKLLIEGNLKGIVQLPDVMSPYMNKMCLVILEKGKIKSKNHKLYMVDFSNEKGMESVYTDENELHIDEKRICEIIKNEEVIEGVSENIAVEYISENNFNLTPAIYFRNFAIMMETGYNTIDILDKQKILIEMYHKSEARLNKAMRDYYTFLDKKEEKQ